MNLSKLTRQYDLLSPWERMPLIMAASARGDDSERERLVNSAPQHGFRLPDYWGLAVGWDRLAILQVLLQLDMAAIYWRLSLATAQAPILGREHARRHQDRLLKALRMIAYRLMTQAEAWKLLTKEMHVDPEELLRPVPGYDSVRLVEQAARCAAYSAEEALAYVRGRVKEEPGEAGPRPHRVETAEEVAALIRQYLENMLDEWE